MTDWSHTAASAKVACTQPGAGGGDRRRSQEAGGGSSAVVQQVGGARAAFNGDRESDADAD